MSQDNSISNTTRDDTQDDDDDDTEEGGEGKISGVWILFEEVVIDPTTKVESRLRFWKVDPQQKGSANPDPENENYAVFYIGDDDPTASVGGKRKAVDFDQTKVFFVPWKVYDYLRCLNAKLIPMLDPGQFYLGGYDWTGKYVGNVLSPPTVQNTGIDSQRLWPDDAAAKASNFSAYFDSKFKQGQNWASVIITQLQKKKDDKWTIKQNLKWKDWGRTGSFQFGSGSQKNNDDRVWIEKNDGVAFSESQYLRLSATANGGFNGAGDDLLRYNRLQYQGFQKDEIYVLRGDMEALKSARYAPPNPPQLSIRRGNGTSYSVTLTTGRPNFMAPEYWTRAWNRAITGNTGGKFSRFRNVDNLDMLFVVTNEARITDIKLEELKNKVIEDAKPKTQTAKGITQTATVVTKSAHIGALKDKYNYMLGLSPFGDFETWIAETSYIAYLEAYPGRELPSDETVALGAFELPTKSDTNKSKTAQAKKAEAKKMKTDVSKDQVQIITVSNNTISRASANGRENEPGQQTIMGQLSATVVATKYDWKGSNAKVDGATTQNIVWDKTGASAAEWLHRCAYSWGNSKGPSANSVPANFVFGSSESNSLMTRYEKSWQMLLQREYAYRAIKGKLYANPNNNTPKAGKKTKPSPLCDLMTANTERSESFTSHALKTDGTTKTLQQISYKWQVIGTTETLIKTTKTISNGVSTNESKIEIPKGDPNYRDYWGWVEKQGNLCFALDYQFDVPRLLAQNFGYHTTVFYPFQRGFYTRLESGLDQALLTYWYTEAQKNLTTKLGLDTTNNAIAQSSGSGGQSTNSGLNVVKAIPRPQTGDTTQNVQDLVVLNSVQEVQVQDAAPAPETLVVLRGTQKPQTMAVSSVQGIQDHGLQSTGPPHSVLPVHNSSQPSQGSRVPPVSNQGQSVQWHQDDHDPRSTPSRGRVNSPSRFDHHEIQERPPSPHRQDDSPRGFDHHGSSSSGPPPGPPTFHGRGDSPGGFGRHESPSRSMPPSTNPHGQGPQPPNIPPKPPAPTNPHGQDPQPPNIPPRPTTPSQPKEHDISAIKVSLDNVDTITAAAWTAVAAAKPLEISGVKIIHPRMATKDDAQALAGLGVVNIGSAADPSSATTFAVLRASNVTQEASVVNTSELMAVSDVPAASSDATAVIPKDFTVTGPIKLFGLFDTQLFSFHGDSSSGLRQIVPLSSGQLKLSSLLPGFANTPLDDIGLRNTMFLYNEFTDENNDAGTWLSTEVVFHGALQPVSDGISGLFGLKDPSLRLETLISDKNDWSQPFHPSTICLEGNIPGLSVKFGDLIEFTDLWIGVNTGQRFDPADPNTRKFIWGFRFSGKANLTMPLKMPFLVMDFSITTYESVFHLQFDASADTVLTKFCGIEGIELCYFSLSVDIMTSSPQTNLSFMANATIQLEDSTLFLSGRYSKDDWFLTCDLENFDFDSLRGLYSSLFNDDLHITEHEIVVDDLSLLLSSDGIIVEGALTIEGYTSVEASISINRLGFEISGAIDGGIAMFDDITIESASFDIFIGRASDISPTGPGTSWRFEIAGRVNVYGTTISARASLSKDQTGKTTWTVYGEFDDKIQLSHLIPTDPPELRQALSNVPWLDLSLTQVAFIASNVDQGAVSDLSLPAGYSVKAGVQLLARLADPNALSAFDDAMKNSTRTPGMIVQLGYGSATSQFSVNIQLPAPQQTSMNGDSITSGPITLGLEFGGSEQVALMIRADFFFRVPPQNLLQFSGGLKVGIDSASMFLNMADGQMWTNPFGLCPQLSLGPRLGLQVGLVYAPPSVSGGVAGSFLFGTLPDGFSGEGAVSVSELPSQELLKLAAEDIGVIKMIKFAASVLGQDIASPTEEFLLFKKVEFYLSTGVSIGTLYYPPGAKFSCDAVLFGIEAKVDCAINKATNDLKIQASISAIHVGPLSVSGTKDGTDLRVDIAISPGSQTLLFDGKITLLDLETYIYVNAELQPPPSSTGELQSGPRFDLRTQLRFTDELTFEITATTEGHSISSMNQMQDFDFSIQASMEQRILDFIQQRINEQIMAAKNAGNASIEDARGQLKTASGVYSGMIGNAQQQVDQAQQAFDARVGVLTKALTDAGQLFTNVVGQLFELWQSANQAFQNLCGGLADALQNAMEGETIAIQNAMQGVSNAMAAASAKIDDALGDLNNANQQMNQQFGDANAHLESAKHSVADCQSSVDQAQRELDSAQDDLNNCEWWQYIYYAGVVAEKGTVLETEKAGLAVAQGVLQACSGFLNDVAYKAAQGAINTCESALEDAKTAGQELVATAQEGVKRITEAQQALVGQATNALHTAQTQSDELATSVKAKQDLDNRRAELSAGIAQAAEDLTNVAKEAVALALATAKAGLQSARGASNFLDTAEDMLEGLEEAYDQILDCAAWLATQGTSVLNIREMEVDGDLRAICNGGQLNVHITGTVTSTAIDWRLHMTPGKGVDFIKDLWNKIMQDSKSGILPLQHRAGWVQPVSRQEKSQSELKNAATKLAALKDSQTLLTGIGFVTQWRWQQATNSVSSAQASNLSLSDAQFAAIEQFVQLQVVTQYSFTDLVTALPSPTLSLVTRANQSLYTVGWLLSLVSPYGGASLDHQLLSSYSGDQFNAVSASVQRRINMHDTGFGFSTDGLGLSVEQVKATEDFISGYDGYNENTVHLNLLIDAGI